MQEASMKAGDKQSHVLAAYFHASFLLSLFFDPEDEDDVFLQDVD
jgi:hypothetical protein